MHRLVLQGIIQKQFLFSFGTYGTEFHEMSDFMRLCLVSQWPPTESSTCWYPLRFSSPPSGICVESRPSVPALTTSYAHGTSSRSLRHSTIGEALLQSVERCPDREALVFLEEGIRKTFAEFLHDVDQTAAGLLALGLQRGDRLGMWGPNIYEWLLYQFATAKAGIILVSVNPAYQVSEVEYALRKVECNAVVCPTAFKTQQYVEMLRKICPEIDSCTPGDLKSAKLPHLRSVIVTDSRHPGMFHVDDVRQAAGSEHTRLLQDLQRKLCVDDPINIQFTSGTTGMPKGATLSHHNIINNWLWIEHEYLKGPSALRSYCFCCMCSLKSCSCTPMLVIIVKTMIKVLMNHIARHFQLGYGTTENSPVTFCGDPLDNEERKVETVGYIMDHVEAKVVNPSTGVIVPLGKTGELMIRGHCVMLGYWNDEDKTRECISPDGWYKTGDIASLDGYSYCRIEGRIKDMIIRGGENIYPAEIEQFLHTHPKVMDAQVVGIKDQRMGEEVCACIMLNEGQECTAEEITAFCKGQIAHFKIPRYVIFVDRYPLTVSGKVQKYKLSEQAEKLLGL
uniref:Medium-chain acyl-CoA ligase ACSF2, mitochondrial n=1 Tax=Gadus morhua TaxID=8049 RepID=A0A8C5CAP4_GADMO